ncbi:MAG TPA: HD domain-containing phosphohydrolase [Verrucomicrobiae bacterium]|nr:HD domain-containing phosphohydrolase [Verrucomicrobiae bacterium]
MPPETKIEKAPPLPILIVDDEEIVLVALRETLTREGYKVVASPHAVHALSLLKEQQFSVVLTDQQMPLISGLEFLARVKESQPDATRILITAVLNLNTIIDAINKGEIYRFVVKPWLREDLLATMKNAVQRHEMLRSQARLHAEAIALNEKLSRLNAALESQMTKTAEQNRQLQEAAKAREKNLRQSIELCVRAMETFHPVLGNQARRVFELCKTMAIGMDLPPDQRQTLEIAALIHDIGLIGIPRLLIRRWERSPHSLNEAEQSLIQRHPILGQEFAGFMDHLNELGPAIRAHHERFDGRGYPDGIARERIPWIARLLAVAVAYAESHLDAKSAAAMIRQGSGSAFDPEAVKIFLRFLPKAVVPEKRREVLLSELRPGMKLAEGIYAANGVLLIADGEQLTAAYIEKLRNHHRTSPISETFLVYC